MDDGKSLFFEEVAYAQQGKYTCRATNAGGSVTKHYTVYVTGGSKGILKKMLKLTVN